MNTFINLSAQKSHGIHNKSLSFSNYFSVVNGINYIDKNEFLNFANYGK